LLARGGDPYLGFEPRRRASNYAPIELTESIHARREFDLVVITDWTTAGRARAQRAAETRIARARRDGGTVGIVSIEGFANPRESSRLGDRAVALLNSGRAELVQLESRTRVETIVICDPTVLRFANPVRSGIDADRIEIEGQRRGVDRGRWRYSAPSIADTAATIFGRYPSWTSAVRAASATASVSAVGAGPNTQNR
jgi:hypothetical protein